VVPIVKAVQELSKMNEEKDAQIKNLQQQIDELKEMMKAGSTAGSGTKQHVTLTAGGLQQNAPNPFNNVTAIAYTLPEKYNHAKIVFTDKSNKTIKEVVLTGKGSGMVNINSSTLNAGTYQYSLYINNVLAETKQMMIIK
jgi:trimeric autotransporter adhesin